MSSVSEFTESRQSITHERRVGDDREQRIREINKIPVRAGENEDTEQIVFECIGVAMDRYASEAYTGLESLYENVQNSDYFYLRNSESGEIVVTSRQIFIPTEYEERKEFEFPFEEAAREHLYDGVAEKIKQRKEYEPETIVEVSALARKKDSRLEESDESGNAKALDLYREMWQYSRTPENAESKKGPKHTIWVALIEKGLDDNLKFAFGEDAVEQVGDSFNYEGGRTTPYVIHLDKCIEGMVGQYEKLEGGGQKFFKHAVMDYIVNNIDPTCLEDHEKEKLNEVGYRFTINE